MSNLYFIYGSASSLVLLLVILFYYLSSLRAIDVYARVNNSLTPFPALADETKVRVVETFKYHLNTFDYPHCLVRVKGKCLSLIKVFDKNLLVVKTTQDTEEYWHVVDEKLFFGNYCMNSSTLLIFNLLQCNEKNAKSNYKIRKYSDYKMDASSGDITISSIKYDDSGKEQSAKHVSSEVLGIAVKNISSGLRFY